MKPHNRIRILLVDDHAVLRAALAGMIDTEPDMEVAADVGDGSSAVEVFRKCRPDLTLMDLRMNGLSGVETIRAIRAESPDARIIVLTTYDGDEDIYRALQAGAEGYLLKDIAPEDFFRTVRSVHRGEYSLPPGIQARFMKRMRAPDLSAREIEVLKFIAIGKSNKEIGTALNVAECTIKTHVMAILKKLDVNDRAQAVASALRRGIIHFE